MFSFQACKGMKKNLKKEGLTDISLNFVSNDVYIKDFHYFCKVLITYVE